MSEDNDQQGVTAPKNSEALGGLGSGPGSTPDTGTGDIGSGSHGGSSATSGPAEGLGGRNTGDNGNSGETVADTGSGSGGSTGETEGIP